MKTVRFRDLNEPEPRNAINRKMPSCDTVNNRGGAVYKFYAIRLTDGYKRAALFSSTLRG